MATKAQRLLPKLIRAIGEGDIAATRDLLDAGADPNGLGGHNATALATASHLFRHPDARDQLVALLLQHGADPNYRGPYNHDNRPIFFAAYCGYDTVVRLLLDAGGFPRDDAGAPARNGDGSTLLTQACTSGLRWLADRALAEGCRADDLDNHGSTALHYATSVHGVTPRIGKDTAEFIDLLLAHGAPLEHQRPGDWGTAMHWAVQQGDAAAVRALVRHGAQLEARTDRSGSTPLQQGAQYGHADAISAAIELGADTTVRTDDGRTLLHIAAARVDHPAVADAEVLRVLLAAGLDPSAVDHSGNVPLAVAAAAITPAPRRKREPLEPSQSELLAVLRAATPAHLAVGLKLPK